ncbi:MAG: type II secretion system protein GspL [Enterobacterales bacterium]|nr:type II secretion system protein GspL [Enterobacterales bacterium]
MAILTIFWHGEKEPNFHWEMRQNSAAQSLTSEQSTDAYQIENHELLKADLNCLSQMAMRATVHLVIASSDAFTTQVQLPKKAQRLLRKAVPFMLEEEVASPVDEMFFALGERSKNEKLEVRAINKNYLEKLIAEFKNAEIEIKALYLDNDFIAAPELGCRLVIDQQECWFINQDNERWSCHTDDFNWLIQKYLATDGDEELPVAIPLEIYAGQECDSFVRNLPVGRFAVEQNYFDDRYQFLLDNQSQPINLLQAEYEPKKETSSSRLFLIQSAKVAGWVLAAFLVYQTTLIYTLSEKKQQLVTQQTSIYKQAFPKVRKVRMPYRSMKSYLSKIGATSGEGNFLTLLSSVSNEIQDLSKIYPTNLSYDNQRKELKLDLIASDLMVLDQFADSLKKAGHSVERSSETQRGSGYSSRITLKKMASQ